MRKTDHNVGLAQWPAIFANWQLYFGRLNNTGTITQQDPRTPEIWGFTNIINDHFIAISACCMPCFMAKDAGYIMHCMQSIHNSSVVSYVLAGTAGKYPTTLHHNM